MCLVNVRIFERRKFSFFSHSIFLLSSILSPSICVETVEKTDNTNVVGVNPEKKLYFSFEVFLPLLLLLRSLNDEEHCSFAAPGHWYQPKVDDEEHGGNDLNCFVVDG